jgi:hypothetical protein
LEWKVIDFMEIRSILSPSGKIRSIFR